MYFGIFEILALGSEKFEKAFDDSKQESFKSISSSWKEEMVKKKGTKDLSLFLSFSLSLSLSLSSKFSRLSVSRL